MSPSPIPRSFLLPSLSFLPRGESKSPSSQVASSSPTVWTSRNWRRPFAYTSTHVRIAPSRDGRGRVCAAGQAGKRKEGEGRSWRNGRGKGRETRGRRPSVDGGGKKKTDVTLRGKRHVERRMRQRHARSERKGKICFVQRGKRPGTSERNGDLELTMWHANNVK